MQFYLSRREMKCGSSSSLVAVFTAVWACATGVLTDTRSQKQPTVLIATLVRNKAHTLPYFLTLIENLDYPKDRISLWIQSDNNVDNTVDLLKTWLETEEKKYHKVYFTYDENSRGFEGEKGIADWNNARFNHVINLREEALANARNIWADFLLMIDADAFLTNPKTLSELISKDETVIAPLLKSDGMYSNFWAGMTKEYYYMRTDRYKPILFREEIGCHAVPMVHSAVLINLKKTESDLLTYNADKLGPQRYDGPRDDIITFAVGANISGIPLHICNDQVYGFITVPLESQDTISQDKQQLTNLKLEILAYQEQLPLSKNLARFVTYPVKDTLGMDKIYMINLLRRPERRERMRHCFKELGILAETIDAVDGRTLNESSLKEWGVRMMPEYADPYHKRPMTMGEVGCFLSHYVIWKKVVESGYDRVMVLEDDIRFEPYFRQKVSFITSEVERLKIDWDLVYLGRKRLQDQEEPPVEGSRYLVLAGYSYWTLGYLLSRRGAEKLLEAKPLENMVPVDEYLPILFDKHPRTAWKGHFPERDLIALSAAPLLLYPTHYTGERGYISDTEDSTVITSLPGTKTREEL
ncbi:glycosyltransferase 25 family member [Neodiprion virginianus]|uniref:glycosyltransferase 25 family member n=1 Tax=Neodiprion virginianus TaxID=2961670 RepID=UPI001EE6C26B|nr:glycosyltransferase 25 family member [Neodiprion virginianus]